MLLLPTSLQGITLGQWIAYTNAIKPLDDQLQDLLKVEGRRRQVLLTGNHVERAYGTVAFFTGKPVEEVRAEYYLDDVLMGYDGVFAKLFDEVAEVAEWGEFVLPHYELNAVSGITFGEFVDAKMLTQAAGKDDTNKWALLQYIAAIFLRKNGEPYDEQYTNEHNERFVLMASLPMDVACGVSAFFEQLNEYVNSHFTVFQDSGEQENAHMKEHMERWGWVNFLKSVAKTKVFDIPGSGMNSIGCARHAKACDVLVWASEEKDYNIAVSRDMEDAYK